MWSLKTNVRFAAILVAAWLIWGTNFIGNVIIPQHEPAHAGEGEAMPAATQVATAEPEEPAKPLPVLLAEAEADKGERVAKKCVSCHTFEKGESNKVGPNLYAVMTRPRAGAEGFNYSSAMQDLGGNWSYEDLDHFIEKPRDFLRGTKMAFAGIRDPEDRAALLLYLRQFHDSPPPLPEAPAQAEQSGDTQPSQQ